MTRAIAVAVAALTLSACMRTSPERQMIDDAAAAMGGRERILAVKTLVIEGDGTNGNLGQDLTPEATTEAFTLAGYKRAIDVVGRRVRIEQTRTPNFAYFQGMAPQKQVLGLDGEVAYNIAANGTAARLPNAAAKDRRAEFYHHPLTIVRAALDPSTKFSQPRTSGSERVVDVITVAGGKMTLAIDAASKLPTRVVSMADNTNLGDVAIETQFADYQDAGGLKLPSRLTTKTDNYTTADLHISKQRVDGDTGDLAAPAAAKTAAPIAGPPAATVTVEELAPGVWLLAGQSHHSVVVEFADHLTLIEAPQNDTRALAVIAKARALRPGKPLTHLVNTHHHFDHSGGVRAAVSEGLTLVTHKGNAAFFESMAARPHTIAPDALAKSPKALQLVTVDGELELKDATRSMTLYSLSGNGHSDTMLMAFLPRERLLVEVDLFSPGSAAQPYAASLLDAVRTRHLAVDRIVPLHGTIATFGDLVKAAAGS
jgi:glyoxylase-like metal-dependent hydrolase (beta-lactamase superfamily II)